jgi:hypothetical protein
MSTVECHMIPEIRIQFNENFSFEKYSAILADITSDFNYLPEFRIAETPFVISDELKKQLLEASNQVVNFIKRPDYKSLTQRAIELNAEVPNEDRHTEFLAVDFGICEENDESYPSRSRFKVSLRFSIFNSTSFKNSSLIIPFLRITPHLLME